MTFLFRTNLKIPEINEDFLIRLKQTHIEDFKNKINNLDESDEPDEITKDNLIKILNLRLSGIIPQKKNCLHILDWNDNKLNNYIGIFDEFDNYYFEFDKIFNTSNKFFNSTNKKFNNNILNQINNIAKSYNDLINLKPNENYNIKNFMIQILELTDNYDDNVELFEYTLIENKIDEFIEKINGLYPDINLNYDKISNELTKKMSFYSLINTFTNIAKVHIHNFILKNKDKICKKTIRNLMNDYYVINDNIKSIFWIVYHNELKYFDNVLLMYSIESTYVEELFKKYESNETEMNQIIEIEKKTNFMVKELEKNINSEIKNLYLGNNNNDFEEYGKKNLKIDKLIRDEIDYLIKTHLSDSDEIQIIKSQLEVHKEMIKMNLHLENSFDIYLD